MARDFERGFYHQKMAEEIKRVLSTCNKNGIFINKKEATAIIAEKSKKGFMTNAEIMNFIKRLRGIVTT